MNETASGMATEAREAPEVVRRQLQSLARPIAELAAQLKRKEPQLVVTCARGSSAHAATFAKHLFERYLGIPVAAAAPNIASIYKQRLRIDGQLFLAISQSGTSDDLVSSTVMARTAGALTVAIVNDVDSPLADASEIVLPMAAGREVSIAATKTFVATLAALLRLAATWIGDGTLGAAVDRLPDRLAAATELDWTAALDALSEANSLLTIGRGPTLAIAREASLKFKETSNLHAEAFSGAEFLHGPVSLVAPLYPVLMFTPTDAAAAGLQELARDLRRKGAVVFTTEPGEPSAGRLPVLRPDHPDTDAVCLIQSFYALAVQLASRRGIDADRPRHLQKITRTK